MERMAFVLGWTFIQFLWQGTALAAAFALLRFWLGRSAQARYRLASLTLIAMTAAPIFTFTAGFGNTGRISWPASLAWLTLALPKLAILWAAGTAFFSIRLAYSWRAASLLRKTGVEPAPLPWQERFHELAARMGASDSVQLWLSSLADAPATTGWLRPIVFFPASMLTGLPPAHIEALLAHELAHVKRMDYAVNILQAVTEAILFYHPAVWWVSKQIRAEREFICDDLAAEICGDRIEYAHALAEMETRRLANLALAANGGPLVARIRRLLVPEKTDSTAPAASTLVAMTLLWIAGAGTVMAQPPDSQAASAAKPIELAAIATPPTPALLFSPFAPAPQAPAPAPAPQTAEKLQIRGRLVTGKDDGVARAEVRLRVERQIPTANGQLSGFTAYQLSSPVLSDEDGSFVFEDIQPGTYGIEVTKTGFLPIVAGLVSSPASSRVTVEPDRSPPPVTLRFTPQAIITGQVIDSFGEPVYPAYIELYQLAYQSGIKRKVPSGRATTDDQGRFRLPMLAEGIYYVLASPGPRSDWSSASINRPDARPPSYYPGVTSLEAAAPVHVTAGSTSAISIRMNNQRLYSIRGRIDYDGPGIPGMFVQVIPVSERPYMPRIETGPFGSRRVLPEGRFEVSDLPPGSYILDARVCQGDRGNQCYDTNTGVPRAEGSVEVTVRGSDVEDVVIQVRNRFTITGTIHLENGDFRSLTPPFLPALQRVGQDFVFPLIGLEPADSLEQPFLAMSDQEGDFQLLLDKAGLYRARFLGTPASVYVKSVRIDGQDALANPVYAGPVSRIDVLLAENPASISGAIFDAEGKPQSGVIVTMWPASLTGESRPSEARSTVTGENGTFTLGSLGPGEYRVAAWEGETQDSGILSAPAFLTQFATQAEPVKLEAGMAVNIAPKLIPASAIAAAAANLP